MSQDALLLGVDVGNSKTEVALARASGEVLATAVGPGASPQALGTGPSWARIGTLTDEVLEAAGTRRVLGAAYAVAGLDFEFEEDDFRAAAPPLPTQRLCVWNDTFAVLRAGTSGTSGIAVVAGAGMNCVGRSGYEVVRYPALGTLSGDWGGGIMLGAEALSGACRSADGRGPRTWLERAVPEHFGMARPADVTLAVHRRELDEGALTGLARLVLEGADAADVVCVGLVERQAAEVVALLEATAARLHADLDELPLVLGGGLLRAGYTTLDEGIQTRLHRAHSGARTVIIANRPVVGAVLLAADLVGVDVTFEASLA